MLVKDGSLSAESVAEIGVKTKGIDCKRAEEIKTILLEEAFANMNKNKAAFVDSFLSFCKDEQH